MATVKAVIFLSDRKLDGTCNAKIRITHKRKSRYIKTPFYVPHNQVTKGGKIKDKLVSDKLDEEVKRYREEINKLGFVVDSLDVDSLISLIRQGNDKTNFIKYAESHIEKLRLQGRTGTANSYSTCIKRLKEYNGSDVLPFSSITKRYIQDFIDNESLSHKPSTLKITIGALKTIYNTARIELNDEQKGINLVIWNCFDGIAMPKDNVETKRSFDSIGQMQRIIDYVCDDADVMYIKDLFVFSFVCFGMNMADIMRIKASDIDDGILTYRRKKVESRMGDKCVMKIKLSDVALTIIGRYIGKGKDGCVFPYMTDRMNRYSSTHLRKLKEGAGLNGDYVFYTARHSMATFARNICGIDMFTVNEMLDHAAPQSLKMTDVYVKRDYSHLWAANEKLLNLFDWGSYLKK